MYFVLQIRIPGDLKSMGHLDYFPVFAIGTATGALERPGLKLPLEHGTSFLLTTRSTTTALMFHLTKSV